MIKYQSMINESEKIHLEKCKETLEVRIKFYENYFSRTLKILNSQSLLLSESQKELDDVEKNNEETTIENLEKEMQNCKEKISFYGRVKSSPFFASLDWIEKGKTAAERVYIGPCAVIQDKELLVCDWRAPVSSMFYDYEIGPAQFKAPEETVYGEIVSKKQYKIKNGRLEFGIEVDSIVEDEILMEALSSSGDGQMKTIITTIQKEQNRIIREDDNKTLIIQGIAGSGKTSIALHRIAYLLYKNKEIKSEEIMIISPSLVYSKFIGSVLPQLGEENIDQCSFESITREYLKGIKLESREDMISYLLQSKDSVRLNAIKEKYSLSFTKKLEEKLFNFYKNAFTPKDIDIMSASIKKEDLLYLWESTYKNQPVNTRINWIKDYILHQLNLPKSKRAEVGERIRKVLFEWLPKLSYEEILFRIYTDLGLEFCVNSENRILYEDIHALLYIHWFLNGIKFNKKIKLLVIDEMQDLSFLFCFILKKMFGNCPVILLGDINQSIERQLDEQFLKDLTAYFSGEFIELKKSYRNTLEISNFAQNILKIKNVENFNRHGNEVVLLKSKNSENAVEIISRIAESEIFKEKRTALICLDPNDTETLFNELNKKIKVNRMIDENINGLLVTNICECKGLEFDCVIVFKNNIINRETGNKAIFAAATRALHNLFIIEIIND